MSYVSFSNSSANKETFHTRHQVSTPTNHNSDTSQLIFEENENETENDLEIQAFLLPFLISFTQFTSIEPVSFSVTSFSEKPANPIYISVCNFRI